MSLVSSIVNFGAKAFNYGKRAAKVYPTVVFENGAEAMVKAAKDAPLKDVFKAAGKAAEQATREAAVGGGFFTRTLKSIAEIPKVLGGSAKSGYKAAGAAGKGIFGKLFGGVKGLGNGILKKMPLIGNVLLIASYLPNIFTATKEQGIGQGVKEVGKSAAKLGGASIGAAIGTYVCPIPVVGSILGWIAGEWLTSKVVGKDYTEKKAEAQEKAQQEALAMQEYQQQMQQAGQIPFQGNPYNENPFATNPMAMNPFNNPFGYSNPYANDIMMQNLKFDTIA